MSLYKSASGRVVDHASSSSIDNFKLCRRKFKLSRIDGWRQKAKKASTNFGKAIEDSIQYYHENGLKPGDGPEEFRRLWAKFIESKELVYTDQEGDWKTLNTMGIEMLKLYEIMLPSLPIKNPKFQLQFMKELWPGDATYGGLKFQGYVDMLSTFDDGSRLVIDIKTAKSMLDVTPNMISLDGQLRKYAWVSGFRDVAFLNFVKAKPDDFKKGTSVTLLGSVDGPGWEAGKSLTVFKFMEAPGESDPTIGDRLVVGTAESVQLMDKACEEIKGKGSTEAKNQLFADYLAEGKFTILPRELVTKVRLQFVRGTIPESDIEEIGDQIGLDIVAMKASSDRNLYPRDGGVRFPNQTCTWCEFNPLCLDDPKRRDETLYQINPSAKEDPKEEDWLSEIEG